MPVLTTVAEQAADGCLVKPLFYQWVMAAEPVAMNLIVDRPTDRLPDQWFHASQHPLATERELWLWITGRAVPEAMGYTGRMATLFGTLMHAPFEAFLDWTGIAEPLPDGDCPACGCPRRPLRARPSSKYCTEHGFIHRDSRARAHLDSILNFDDDRYGLDLKTIYPMGLKGVRDMDPEAFKAKWPKYWAQMQECMRLSGLRRYIVLFVTMGSPWDLREYHFGFDPDFAAATEAKYRRVLSCAERGLEIVA